jgi:hypothetical protein
MKNKNLEKKTKALLICDLKSSQKQGNKSKGHYNIKERINF